MLNIHTLYICATCVHIAKSPAIYLKLYVQNVVSMEWCVAHTGIHETFITWATHFYSMSWLYIKC